jgi:hypothetical protein
MINTYIVHIPTHDINVVFDSYHIVSWDLWQPLVDLCWHFVRVTLDIGHVKGFVEVPFPRVSHWNKRKGFIEKVFSNGRLDRRPYLLKLIRLEPPRGKRFGERRIMGRWSREMSFKIKSSRKVEMECPLDGVVRKAKEKALG